MKRACLLALALSLAMGGTAFGAEQVTVWEWKESYVSDGVPVWEYLPSRKTLLRRDFQKMEQAKLFLDNQERELQHPLQKDGDTMLISVVDFADIFRAEVISSDTQDAYNRFTLQIAKTDTEAYRINRACSSIYVERANFAEDTGKARNAVDGVTYIPLREMAEKWPYTINWQRTKDGEKIMVDTPQQPKISVEAGYVPEGHTAVVTMKNLDERDFMYGYGFFLEKWDGSSWHHAEGNAEVCYATGGWELPDSGIPVTAQRSLWHYGDGVSLEAGRYRICQEVWEKDMENRLGYTLYAEFDVE